MESYLYVVEAHSLTTYTPIMRVDTFAQANIVIAKSKEFFPDAIFASVGTTDLIDVPHFNDYTWN